MPKNNAGQFKTGHAPWNSGKSGSMKGKPGYQKSAATQFKPGVAADNRVAFGSERFSSGQLLIKTDAIDPHTGYRGWWRCKARLCWEEAHGPVPAAHVISMLDGDPMNTALENLVLLTRGEVLILNRWGTPYAGPDVNPARIAVAKLRVLIARRQKNGCNNKGTD